MRLFGMTLVLATAMLSGIASAAEIEVVAPADQYDGAPALKLKGVIKAGDADRFRTALTQAANYGRPVHGIFLSSPGGEVIAGVLLANAIRAAGIPTIVGNNRLCA